MLKLITENRELCGLLVLLGVSAVVNLLFHWIFICNRLLQHGSRRPTGLLFWRVFSELRHYKDITTRNAKPLTFYYLGFILTWFTLLLAFATALRMAWVQSHPGGY
jgi:hypothetical protein